MPPVSAGSSKGKELKLVVVGSGGKSIHICTGHMKLRHSGKILITQVLVRARLPLDSLHLSSMIGTSFNYLE
jgi:hypothetical protein